MRLANHLTKIALVLGTLPLAALAGDNGTVYTQLGTKGLSLGYAASVGDDWAVRGQYNYMTKQKYTGDVGDYGSGANITVDLDWSSAEVLADWYPASNGFRVTGGLVQNFSKITVTGTGTVGATVGATVNAEIKMSDGIAPYLGIGYAAKPKTDKGLGFNFDLGVMFQNPKATLTSSASASDTAQKQREMQDAADKLKYYPVVSFGLSYSF